MKKKLLIFIDILRSWLLPDRCSLCGRVIRHTMKVCKKCRKNAAVIRVPRCLNCGMGKKKCACKGKRNFYNGITAPFEYTDVVRTGIKKWKYREFYRNGEFYGTMIAHSVKETFPDIDFDVITFVPQTPDEMKERKYNQSEQLADMVSKELAVPVMPLLKKIHSTKRQHDLPLFLRSGNIFGAFECQNHDFIKGKVILLIDDVKTSGKTINECAKMLHLRGAALVYCGVVAVAPQKKKKTNKRKNIFLQLLEKAGIKKQRKDEKKES